MNIETLHQDLLNQIKRVIMGQDEVIDYALAALLSGGHVLFEGLPGTAKTLLVHTIAHVLKMEFRRVQMTPDLLPADITGSNIYREDQHAFEFLPGPVFTNFLLADEINRASARTQSALLEAMQELHVTHNGVSHPLPRPFIVFATQNPVEQEGTYPLPMAQLDRFMFKILIDYPQPEDEEQILMHHHATGGNPAEALNELTPVVGPGEIVEARMLIRQTYVREEIIGYVRRLVQLTREEESLTVGASPRAGLMLLMAAKCLARFGGRDFVTPDDIKSAFRPAMRHRLVLSPTMELEGVPIDTVLDGILEMVEVPR